MNVLKTMRSIKLSFTFVSLGCLLALSSIAAIANAQEAAPATTSAANNAPAADRTDVGSPAATREVGGSTTRAVPAQPALDDGRRAALQARAQERITNLAANLSNRLEAAITRLESVASRLESRAAKLAATGADTTSATAAIEAATGELAAARAALSSIDADVAAFVGSETPRERWALVRTSFSTAKDAVLRAHQGLRNAVAALKAAAVADGETASDAVRAEAASTSPTTE